MSQKVYGPKENLKSDNISNISYFAAEKKTMNDTHRLQWA